MENVLLSSEFIKLEEEPTNMCIQEVHKVLKDIQGVLTDKDKVYLKLSNSTVAKLYDLPKIHKPGNEIRSLISFIGATNYNLAKF